MADHWRVPRKIVGTAMAAAASRRRRLRVRSRTLLSKWPPRKAKDELRMTDWVLPLKAASRVRVFPKAQRRFPPHGSSLMLVVLRLKSPSAAAGDHIR